MRRLLLPTVLILLQVGCAGGGRLECVAPERVGMDPAKVAAIRPVLHRYVEDDTAAGIVALVAKDGRIVSLDAVGHADLASDRAMTRDTIFRIASMTKPITAAALMILVDEGEVAVDDPVSKYIPSFADARPADGALDRPVTLRDCLTHTAGLGGAQIFDGTLAQNAEDLADRPLDFQPGDRWQYSPGLNIIGRVIEIVSGQSYGDFLQERLFDPLGMVDTTFFPNHEQWTRVATVYRNGEDGGLTPVTSGWSLRLGRELEAQPSGGLFSTAQDLAAFYQMVLNGGTLGGKRILSADSASEMVEVHTDNLRTGFTNGNAWGLGWCLIRNPQGATGMLSPGTFGHGGAFGTQGWVDPERKMVFVLLIQREGLRNADGSDLRKDFQQAAVDALN